MVLAGYFWRQMGSNGWRMRAEDTEMYIFHVFKSNQNFIFSLITDLFSTLKKYINSFHYFLKNDNFAISVSQSNTFYNSFSTSKLRLPEFTLRLG